MWGSLDCLRLLHPGRYKQGLWLWSVPTGWVGGILWTIGIDRLEWGILWLRDFSHSVCVKLYPHVVKIGSFFPFSLMQVLQEISWRSSIFEIVVNPIYRFFSSKNSRCFSLCFTSSFRIVPVISWSCQSYTCWCDWVQHITWRAV